MSHLEAKLEAMGLVVPKRDYKAGKLLAVKQDANLLYVGGHGPTDSDGVMRLKGKLGADLTLEQGYQAARNCALVALGNIKSYLGNLDRIEGVVKVLGFVNSTPDFAQHGDVIHGFSDLWLEVMGEAGRHARSAVGVASLPGNIAVEVECILRITP